MLHIYIYIYDISHLRVKYINVASPTAPIPSLLVDMIATSRDMRGMVTDTDDAGWSLQQRHYLSMDGHYSGTGHEASSCLTL